MIFRSCAALLILCALLTSCGEDTATEPNGIDLPELLISTNSLALSAPIVWDCLELEDPNIDNVSAYLGEFAPENYLGTLSTSNKNKQIVFQISLETKDRFIRYESLNPDSISCMPNKLARTKMPVRFFTVVDDQKQYEVFLEQLDEENTNEFGNKYEIYFWSEKGTVEGYENGYSCNYQVEKGWNVTMCDGKSLTNVKEFDEETYFVIRDQEKKGI